MKFLFQRKKIYSSQTFQQHLITLKNLKIRTQKRSIAQVYTEVYGHFADLFFKECHRKEDYSLNDFLNNKVNHDLIDLAASLEELTKWCFPDTLPPEPYRHPTSNFLELENPYQHQMVKRLPDENISHLGTLNLIAAFNIYTCDSGPYRTGLLKEILQELQQYQELPPVLKTINHFDLEIPKIGLNMVSKKLYILDKTECFLYTKKDIKNS
jgi:hypothetical protein